MRTEQLWLLAAAAFAGAACNYNPYCLTCVDGGVRLDAMAREAGPDAAREGGSAGDGGGADGSGVCDPLRTDDDPRNCGQCGRLCNTPHAPPFCAGGQCVVRDCDIGWVDLNRDPADGCEYQCLASGTELCDGRDNDCNGITDDGFDLQNDPRNCGRCGMACEYTNALARCAAGACTLAMCTTGYVDVDRDPSNGCEYHCPVSPPLPYELCNGLDDNCDGRVDEASALQPAPMGLCNTRAGTPCAGTTAVCTARGGVTQWYCNYGAGVEFDPSVPNGIVPQEVLCNGLDGDCNGVADDSFADLGRSCDNGSLGACRVTGTVQCDSMNNRRTACVLPPGPAPTPQAERCNNLDDDCDGVVDNVTGTGRIRRDMVQVTSGATTFWIDRFEASRPDATGAAAGTVNRLSCSNGAVLPWTRVSYDQAQAACAAAGVRLCTAAEWGAACGSAAYPYGATYQGATCNGADFDPGGGMHLLAATGDARLAMCVTPGGARDLSGNAKEWTSDQQGTTSGATPQPIYVVRGGSFLSPQVGLTCSTTFSRAAANVTLEDLGFRCCSSTAP